VSSDELATLRAEIQEELADPRRSGTTFTLIGARGELTSELKRQFTQERWRRAQALGC
jgi:hypothetical protein